MEIMDVPLRNHPPTGLISLRREAAFSLAETLMAVAISIIAATSFYAAAGQAVRIVKTGKETAYASQMLQQRVESFRATPLWANVTTVDGLNNLMTGATATAANFPGATETCTVVTYPNPGTPLIVTRSPGGIISSSGPSLSTEKCVKVTFKVNWIGTGHTSRSREVATVLTKGGL